MLTVYKRASVRAGASTQWVPALPHKLHTRSSIASAGVPSGCPTGRRNLTCLVRSAGSGVVDAPTATPTIEKGVEHVNKRPPIYKVLLHNDNYNKREYVVRVLMKVVPSITSDDALVVMQEAHESGVALVLACPQNEAEQYCEGLRGNGLTSTMEPGC